MTQNASIEPSTNRNNKTMNISLDETKINEIKTQLSLLANNLLDALDSNDQAQAFIAQQALTDAINSLWNAAEDIDIDPKVKAISRLVGCRLGNDRTAESDPRPGE